MYKKFGWTEFGFNLYRLDPLKFISLIQNDIHYN